MKYKHIIEVRAKEWFDRVNGNSYFSARVYLDDEEIAVLPFQYGYGSHYEHMAMQAIKGILKDRDFEFDDNDQIWRICAENNIKLITNKQEKIQT